MKMSAIARFSRSIAIAGFTVVAALAQDASADETHTISHTFKYAPNSAGAADVERWLNDRALEGHYPTILNAADDIKHSFISGEIVTVLKGSGPTPNLIGGGGTTLPPTGSDGETIQITDCVPGVQTTTYYYKWVPDSTGGHWECYKTVQTVAASVSCNT